jgi:BAI1-associated protein 3
MAAKADALEKLDVGEGIQKFVVTKEWCCAINDLYYIRSNLQKIIEDFKVKSLIDRLPDMDKENSAETLNSIYTAALAREQTHITKFIDELAARMAPNLQLYLTDGAASLDENCESMDKLMAYLEDSLTTLNGELNIQNFERVMDTMWLEICRILDNKIKYSSLIDVRENQILTDIFSNDFWFYRKTHNQASIRIF